MDWSWQLNFFTDFCLHIVSKYLAMSREILSVTRWQPCKECVWMKCPKWHLVVLLKIIHVTVSYFSPWEGWMVCSRGLSPSVCVPSPPQYSQCLSSTQFSAAVSVQFSSEINSSQIGRRRDHIALRTQLLCSLQANTYLVRQSCATQPQHN